jgi:uncharacterized membrane protein YozB (DUF420 family)
MSRMYQALLFAHSWIRWVVLLLGLTAFVFAASGRFRKRPWTSRDEAVGRWFVISVDVQVLLGLVLYLLFSSFTVPALRNLADAMADTIIRFWAVEHLVGMLAATAFAHVGRRRIRKAPDAARKHFTAAVFFGLALVLMVISIPWPFGATGRPMFRAG